MSIVDNQDERRGEALKMLEQYYDARVEAKLRRSIVRQISPGALGKAHDAKRNLEKAERDLAIITETILELMGVDE